MSAVPPSSCRAALLVEPGKPMEIADVRVPDVLERGALLAGCLSAGLDHYYGGCASWCGTPTGFTGTT